MRAIRYSLAAAVAAMAFAGLAHAAIYVKIPPIDGDVTASASPTPTASRIVWDKEPVNGGSGMVTLHMAPNSYSESLMRYHRTGAEIPYMTITSEERDGTTEYTLERVYVKSWSTSGDADDRPTEEVAFYYNKIAFKPSRVRASRKR